MTFHLSQISHKTDLFFNLNIMHHVFTYNSPPATIDIPLCPLLSIIRPCSSFTNSSEHHQARDDCTFTYVMAIMYQSQENKIKKKHQTHYAHRHCIVLACPRRRNYFNNGNKNKADYYMRTTHIVHRIVFCDERG